MRLTPRRGILERFMQQQLRDALAALRAKQAARYLGMGESTFWRKAKTDPASFPQPIKLGPGTTVWLVADLDDYLQRCADVARKHRGGQHV